ncbi:LTA synthase family protein [Enterococcus lemanii]|uniref:LTA synthase family protein n=1 Tax=Enterococcus lemanii TaxID=1159752 RepID=A0ABV9MSW9_9ENTE|nr:alkaline phosphatase family protein [Enterococcus lemanii]MBM7709074.1 phosphoglycerol transferase MdoB-like AlkP superfamily enzyme [Enterococcus lemanii]
MKKIIIFFENNFVKSALALLLSTIFSIGILVVTLVLSSAKFNELLFQSYLASPLLLLMNIIPIILIMVLLYFIFNTLWLSYLLTVILFVGGGLVNKFKLTYRDDPFVFRDLKLFAESLQMSKQYSLTVDQMLVISIIILLLFTIVIKLFINIKIKSKKTRVINIVLMGILAGVFGNSYFDEDVYALIGDETLINRWIGSQQFQSKGFVYPFLYSAKGAKEIAPEHYDEDQAIETLATFNYQNIAEDQKVNVISIMLEAYNDFSKFDTVEIREDVYQDFHDLQEQAISGDLVTNIFAGGTINTERAFLTGYYSYTDFYKNTNSHVWYMKEQGYTTETMHPITGSFYNRRNVNEFLGFDHFDHYDNRFRYVQEPYLSDWAFFDVITESFENSITSGKPYFHFSTTYQNHGPYDTEAITTEEYLVNQEGYNIEDYNIANNYLSGIKATNEAIKKLITYFEQREEPVVVVLFGDHNPWLGVGNSVYEMLGIDLDVSEVTGFKNYYTTPYVIWGNAAATEVTRNGFIAEGQDLSPNHLMTEVFEQIGWAGNEFMQYLKGLKEEIPVNHTVFFEEQGVYIQSEEIAPASVSKWEEYLNIEYYLASTKPKK